MKKNYGFTLIELMITVAIIGILASIAYPSYMEYVRRSHRAEARNTLNTIAQRMEQNYNLSGAYDVTSTAAAVNDTTIAGWGLNQTPVSGNARYNFGFSAGPTATTFTIAATPVGSQASDTCGVLSLNERNLKAAQGENPNTAGVTRSNTTATCWQR